jgi:p-hydroxybenzoate 3-monooxygenase
VETVVCVVGAGPGGLVLAHVLRQAGIPVMILERLDAGELRLKTKAGQIERRTVELLRPHGLADSILERGSENGVCEFRADGQSMLVDFGLLTGSKGHYVYAQHLLVGDLADAFVAAGGDVRFGTRATAVEQRDDWATVTARVDATGDRICVRCRAAVGCDGAGGVVASAVPRHATFAHDHPFRWLTLIAGAPPMAPRTVYALHPRGFAGQMLRGPELTRYLLEIPQDEGVADWPAERIWPELAQRLHVSGQPPPTPVTLLERDVVDLRVRVLEPMQSGRVFLVGDAAHLITPAGGKGMNLAIQDAIELAAGLRECYGPARDGSRLARYSATRLPEIWRAQEFSNWMLSLMHASLAPGGDGSFAYRLRRARLQRLFDETDFARWFARAYAGINPTSA